MTRLRPLLIVAALAALTVTLLLMATDTRGVPQREVRDSTPFTINGEPGWLCDVEIVSNDGVVDDATAECEEPNRG